jgi:serine/threonine-protein kinase
VSNSKIEKKIKQARIAAMVSGTITLAGIVTLINNQTGGQLSLFNILAFIDVIFIFSMAYGIYRKSRECAFLMFVYFLLSKILIISTSPRNSIGTFIIALIFLYFLFQGIRGTFAYHRCIACREKKQITLPVKWLIAGSGALVIYVIVLPGLILLN